MVERRHKFTVFYDFLSCCSPGQVIQANIRLRVNLNTTDFNNASSELLQNGLLSFKISRGPAFKRYSRRNRRPLPPQNFYSTTPKGFEFMRKYQDLLSLSVADVNLQVSE
jgi:predicted transcriptional regulator